MLLVFAVIGAFGYGVYHNGYKTGSKDVQQEWDKEKASTANKMLELKTYYEAQRILFEESKQEEVNELKDKMEQQKQALAVLNDSFHSQLQQSEARSKVYQRQASSTEAERRSLADHAARLDSALTEGIRLVRELAATLKLRDDQLKFVGKYLQDTYNLIGK